MLALISADGEAPPDLSVSGGRYVAAGYDLQTAAWMTLHCEGPARPGDPVPEGRDRNGWWGAFYLDPGETWGSRWWTLKYRKSAAVVLPEAEQIVKDAFAPWVRLGWASAILCSASYVNGADGLPRLFADTKIVAPDGAIETFSAWQEVA